MSLYCLMQSPRTWFDKFNIVAQQFGLFCSEVDHSVFYHHLNAWCIYLVLYVDGIVLTSQVITMASHMTNLDIS